MILAGLGCTLILAAAGLAMGNFRENRQAEKLSAQAAELLETAIAARLESHEHTGVQTQATAAEESPVPEMATMKIYSREYIGLLSIPSLELELPVISTWSDELLRAAPCLFHGSVYTGDMVIAGHNFPSHFGRLSTLSPGDRLSFTDVNGSVYTYEVTKRETLGETQVEEMCSWKSGLSLFTCTAGGEERFTLRCSLTAEG